MPVLADTSVWIDFFRGTQTPQVVHLKRLIGREEILLGDLILAEILQGARDVDVPRIEAALSAFRVMPLVGSRVARQSAANYRRLRSEGITVRKTIDVIIATWCIQNSVPLLHANRDFHWFARLGLTEVWQEPPVV